MLQNPSFSGTLLSWLLQLSIATPKLSQHWSKDYTEFQNSTCYFIPQYSLAPCPHQNISQDVFSISYASLSSFILYLNILKVQHVISSRFLFYECPSTWNSMHFELRHENIKVIFSGLKRYQFHQQEYYSLLCGIICSS